MPGVEVTELESGLWKLDIEGDQHYSFEGTKISGKIIFGENYPEESPCFILETSVPHINIHPQTGQVNPLLFSTIWNNVSSVSNCI